MARPSKYDAEIRPHIAEVRRWAASGATNKEIADALGIAVSTLCDYKIKHREFSEAFARGRVAVCCDIKAALLKKALGFEYQEKKQYIRKDVNTGQDVQYTEISTRQCLPSETAAAMLLRNYDNEWRDGDSITQRFKQQEQELKRRIAEANNFMGD